MVELDRDEMLLFRAACADPGNAPAQELLNVFGAETADLVLESIAAVPFGLFAELATQIDQAIEEARQRDQFRARFRIGTAENRC